MFTNIDITIIFVPTLSSTSSSYAVVPEGNEHIVSCKSTTTPKPTITWKRNGVILDPENDPRYELLLPNYDLRIPSADEGTAGKYRCILRNEDGVYEIGWDLSLIVGSFGKEFVYPARDNYFYDSNPIAWTNCMSPVAKPPAEVIFINGSSKKPVDKNDPRIELRMHITGTNQLHQLIINGATEYDTSDQWECRAKNRFGSGSSFFKIEHYGPPPAPTGITITHRLNGFIMKWEYVRNDLVYYDIFVTSASTTQKFRLKESFEPKNPYYLQYEVTGLGQGVNYEVKIRAFDRGNNTGAWSETVYVTTVTEIKPYITEPLPLNIAAGEGLKHVIKCHIRGKPLPDITWKKNDQDISSDSEYEVDLKNGTLTILNPVRTTTDGVFRCFGKNNLGSIESNKANLKVEWIEDKFQRYPRNQTFYKGVRFLRFSCRPPKANPEAKVEWYFNGRKINTLTYPTLKPTHYRGPTGVFFYALDVRNPSTVLAGEYSCVASNAGGKKFGDFSITEILPKIPFVTREVPRTITITANDTVTETLQCKYLGDPVPFIVWYKDNKPVDLSNDMFSQSTNGEVLSLVGVNKHHRGNYYCNASNIHGHTATQMGEVRVIYVDKEFVYWEKETLVYNVDGHRDVEIICRPPVGYPLTRVIWSNGTENGLQYKDNPDLTYKTDNRSIGLHVMHVSMATKYIGNQIGCAAYNDEIGFAKYNLQLTTLVLTDAPSIKALAYKFESSRKLKVSWELTKPRKDVEYTVQLYTGNQVVMTSETRDNPAVIEHSFIGLSEMSIEVNAVDKAGQQSDIISRDIDDKDIPLEPSSTTTPATTTPAATTTTPPPTTPEPTTTPPSTTTPEPTTTPPTTTTPEPTTTPPTTITPPPTTTPEPTTTTPPPTPATTTTPPTPATTTTEPTTTPPPTPATTTPEPPTTTATTTPPPTKTQETTTPASTTTKATTIAAETTATVDEKTPNPPSIETSSTTTSSVISSTRPSPTIKPTIPEMSSESTAAITTTTNTVENTDQITELNTPSEASIDPPNTENVQSKSGHSAESSSGTLKNGHVIAIICGGVTLMVMMVE